VTVSFIGLGLNDERGLTIEGLEEARRATTVFAEFYTNIMPRLDRKRLEDLIGKKIAVLSRMELEDEEAKRIADATSDGDVAFLVPGDPMVATTHVSVRLGLAKRGITSRIIHAASVMSAVCGATGLQGYKFGKSVTLPLDPGVPVSLLEVIHDNKSRRLHTLILLDIRPETSKQLIVTDAVSRLMEADHAFAEVLGVGLARIGARDQEVFAATLKKLRSRDFGNVPHSLVIPGRLHFVEAESLKAFCGANDNDLEALK